MRKVIVLTFVTLDGVMQAPGGPEEDTSGSFLYGGWSVPFWDDVLSAEMTRQMGQPFDLLLGRTTYDIFAASWPDMDPENPINSCRKYVATYRDLPADTAVWQNSIRLEGDVVERVRELKQEGGPDLQVHGSAIFLQTLLGADLVDELWLKIYPVTLGAGKRLFADGTIPASFLLRDSKVSDTGVLITAYERVGEVETGTFN